MWDDEEFWAEEVEELVRVLIPLIEKAGLASAKQAAREMARLGFGVDWNLVNDRVVDWAWRYGYELVKEITETSREFLREEIPSWIQSDEPLEVLIEKLEPMFGAKRAEMIGVTETTRAFAQGNLETWRESGVVDGKKWFTAEDELVCEVCRPLAGTETGLDGMFDGGEYGPLEGPPAHVNCRCAVRPVVAVPKAGTDAPSAGAL